MGTLVNICLRRTLPLLAQLPGILGARAAFVRARDALGSGTASIDLVEATIVRLLRHADASEHRGEIDTAADMASKALHLIFHPTRRDCLAPNGSVREDRNVLAPLAESAVLRAITSPAHGKGLLDEVSQPRADKDSPQEEATRIGNQPLRVVVCGHRNMLFADRLIASLSADKSVLTRRIDLSALGLDEDVRLGPLTRERLGQVHGEKRLTAPPELKEAIEWADVVFGEWGNHALAYLSMLDGVGLRRGGTALVTRVHHFEIDTAYFHLVDLDAVDHWVFIAEHIRRRAARLRGLSRAKTSVIPNVNNLRRFTDRKVDGAERTIIHTDWSRRAKDVRFAFEVLRRLRSDGEDWRLLLTGRLPSDTVPAGRALLNEARMLGEAVEVLGYRDDMPEVMQRAGFVLSSSRSEGSHEVVAEGASAACVPIVRDWPLNRADGGASSVYPVDWVVQDEADAVQRIRDITVDGAVRERGRQAREYILRERDDARVRDLYVMALRRVVAGE